MCCCCCPPAISALFCLWCQSGCSKGSVAGALTFFPPDPPLYSFEKRDANGALITESFYEDGESSEDDGSDNDSDNSSKDNYGAGNDNKSSFDSAAAPNPNEACTEDEDDEDGKGASTKGVNSDKKKKAKKSSKKKSSSNNKKTKASASQAHTTAESGGSAHSKEQMRSPAQQLLDKNQELRRNAKRRNARDARDAELGIQYSLVLDPRLAVPPYDTNSVTCVKVPAPNGIYVAAVVYKCPQQEEHPVDEDINSSNPTCSFLSFSLGGSSSSTTGPTSSTEAKEEQNKDLLNDKKPTKKFPKTIIYSHGNATDVGAMFPLQAILAHSLECNVVSYDYSGYGESGGIPLENNTYRDIEAVYNYVLENLAENDPSNIILYGQSVGSGPCCHLAAQVDKKTKDSKIGGLILHSPFTSGMRVLTPSRLLACLDIFPNIDRIKKVKCPVMVIHGRLDEEVEIHHGFQLHNAVPAHLQRDPWWVNDRGHNDITEGPGKLAEYVRRLRDYLATL